MDDGRVKPLDSVARNLLQLLGNRTTVRMPDESRSRATPQGSVPAARWLLALMAGSDWATQAPVFRIDADEVKDLFDLPRRKGHRYSAAELETGRESLQRQIREIRDVPADQRSFAQKKYAEIDRKLAALKK